MVEGCGNNGCEYMTGGNVVILGEVGFNFAAGMSGGFVYVYDPDKVLAQRCNQEMVRLEKPSADDLEFIHELIAEHVDRTASPQGIMILYQFKDLKKHFVKVVPNEYQRALDLTRAAEAEGLDHEAALERAYQTMTRGE